MPTTPGHMLLLPLQHQQGAWDEKSRRPPTWVFIIQIPTGHALVTFSQQVGIGVGEPIDLSKCDFPGEACEGKNVRAEVTGIIDRWLQLTLTRDRARVMPATRGRKWTKLPGAFPPAERRQSTHQTKTRCGSHHQLHISWQSPLCDDSNNTHIIRRTRQAGISFAGGKMVLFGLPATRL